MHVPLQSSLLAWVRWEAGRLQVQLRSGERYQYFAVPEVLFQHLLQAPSHGAFFNYYIRNCFPCQHLSQSSTPIVLATPQKTK